MISLYSGTPGSYKSYHAVAECISWLRLGRNLICNFPVDYKRVIKKPIKGDYIFLFDDQITVKFLLEYAKAHHKNTVRAQTLVVIDEASLKFNPREFSRADRLEWINFLANHRHFNFEFILITQSDRMIDRQIRSLIETEYKHRAIKNFNFLCFLVDLLFRGCFLSVEYWYPCKLRVGSEFKIFHRRIAKCYDTMALFVGENKNVELAKEVKTIVQVNDEASKKQVHEDMSKLVTVLSSYVQCNNQTSDGSCNSRSRRRNLFNNCFGRFINGCKHSNRKQ